MNIFYKALLKYTLQFDGFKPKTASSLKVSQHEIEIAKKACSKRAVSALKDAKKRILDYHRHLFPHDFNFEDDFGVRLGARWRAISDVGVSPDIEVEEQEKDFSINTITDNQLNYAVKLLNG